MEHHYSLTTRMLVIFVCGLMLLAALIFVAGLLIGRDWGETEALMRAKEAPATSTTSTPPAAATPNSATGAIRPTGALPATPAAPALPAVPSVLGVPAPPAVPAIPAPPKAPALPSLHPLKSSSVAPDDADFQPVRAESGARSGAISKVSARIQATERATSDTKVRGYIVYVAAYTSGARAEKLAEQLSGRNLATQTRVIDNSGQKQLVGV